MNRPADNAPSSEWRAYWDERLCQWCGGVRPAFIAEEPLQPRCLPQNCARTGMPAIWNAWVAGRASWDDVLGSGAFKVWRSPEHFRPEFWARLRRWL